MKNQEDVELTIKEIREQQSSQEKRGIVKKVFAYIFFPVTLIVMAIKKIFAAKKMPLTLKTTIVFTVVFGALIIGYVVFAVVSVQNYLRYGTDDAEGFIRMMTITSSLLAVVFIVLGAVAGSISSQALLQPIKRIISQIDEYDSENLSARIELVDTQDELTELVQQINNMLGDIENVFSRQANFVSDASHELRTPLSVIQGYADVLQRWGKDDKALLDEGLNAISRESARMGKIMDQLLLLARIGRYSLNKTRFNLTEELSQLTESYRVINSTHDIEFVRRGNVGIESDKSLLTEAVRTLIDNAVKYTPKGGKITVSVSQTQKMILILVKDNGPGIPESELNRIFDRFYRCDKARRAGSGAGLGLTISKSIVETLGGGIKAYSKEGEGSTFAISFSRKNDPVTEIDLKVGEY